MKLKLTSVSSLAALLLVTGCKLGPNYKRPVAQLPPAYRSAPELTVASGAPLGTEKWSDVFTDPVLQSLIAEALKNNYDVKIAADRVSEQQAQVGVTRAAQFPTVNVGASYNAIGLPSGLLSGNSNNNNNGNNTSNNQSSSTNYFAGGLTSSAAWNLDFWGLYRRQTEAARAQLRANEFAQQTTYSSLVQSVASSYYQLRTLDAELEVTRQTIDAREQSLKLTNQLEQGGATSLADVRQAEQLLYSAKAQLPDLERQITQQENNFSILLGRNPGPIARGNSPSDVPHPAVLPVGLPSDLLERRPDIRRAEQLLVAANANIGAARAQYFPQLSITATAGISSSQLKGLIESKNAYYYAVGTLAQPIFDGGKIRNNYRLAVAQHQELLDTYQQTIAAALRDVDNALSAYDKSAAYLEAQRKQEASAQDAVRLARIRYNAGSTAYLEVLTNDTNLYTAQLSLQNAELQQASSLIQLYNALGGGW